MLINFDYICIKCVTDNLRWKILLFLNIRYIYNLTIEFLTLKAFKNARESFIFNKLLCYVYKLFSDRYLQLNAL